MKKVAVVILNWNGVKFLREFLPVLIRNTPHEIAEIVVADNASTDESLKVLSEEFPEIHQIALDKNYGFAGGYNKALAQIEAEYFVLLNSDVEVTANWLEPMLDYLELKPQTAACQPKLRSYYKRNLFEHAGACGGYIDQLGYPFCRGRVLAQVEEDKGQYDSIKEVFWATGACLMIRSKAYHAVGGLDDDFFAHMEEIDLCWRLKARGQGIVCIPESVVFHVGGGTLNQESPRKTYLNFRNNLLLLYKNLPVHDFRKVFFARFFLDYLAAVQLFVTGKPKNALAILEGRRDFLKIRKTFRTKRVENMKKTSVESISEIYKGSIIFRYYILGKKQAPTANS